MVWFVLAYLEDEVKRVDEHEQDDDGKVGRDERSDHLVLLRHVLHKRKYLS